MLTIRTTSECRSVSTISSVSTELQTTKPHCGSDVFYIWKTSIIFVIVNYIKHTFDTQNTMDFFEIILNRNKAFSFLFLLVDFFVQNQIKIGFKYYRQSNRAIFRQWGLKIVDWTYNRKKISEKNHFHRKIYWRRPRQENLRWYFFRKTCLKMYKKAELSIFFHVFVQSWLKSEEQKLVLLCQRSVKNFSTVSSDVPRRIESGSFRDGWAGLTRKI